MKLTIKTTVILATMCIALMSVSCGSSDDPVEYWKPTIVAKFQRQIIDSCLEKHFNSMVESPNEYQLAYLKLAETFCHVELDLRGEENLEQKVTDWVLELSSWLLRDFNPNVVANFKSHPEMYAENVNKIIGPFDKLRDEISKSVEVEKVETEKVSNHKRYYVLYNIDNRHYAVCCITEAGEGRSEIQFLEDDKSISTILDYWQMLNDE